MIEYRISDGLCVLRLDAPPVNALCLALLAELGAALRRANADIAAGAIVITGGPAHFSAGADMADFNAIRTAEDAVGMSRVFQDALQEIEDSSKPVVAAVAGKVVGGALELAMACHYRIAAEGSVFAMPEIRLGINPGAGGTQRLPRLVGLRAALDMLLGGKAIGAQRALQIGLIDAVCPAAEFVECTESLLAVKRLLGADGASGRLIPVKTSQRTDRLQDAAANAAALAESQSQTQSSRPEILAPQTILAAVRAGMNDSLAAGLLAEQNGFRDCMATLATQNKFYLFAATRLAPKLTEPDQAPGPTIAKAAVIGFGTMGTGIAQALITAGLAVVAYDENAPALERGVEKIRKSLAGRVAQGRLTSQSFDEIMQRLTTTGDRQRIADADLVVESVFEDVEVKRAALRFADEVCPPQTILASNTSTISLDKLAEGLRRPERLLGMHFFNPAHHMPLVEVIRRRSTPPPLVAAVMGLARKMEKTPVLVRNREGFLVNRLFIPYLKEAFWLLEEGFEPESVDRAMVDFGFAMGPFVLIDMAGLDILVLADRMLQQAFPRHGGPAQIAERLVQEGQLGQKTGAGVFRYQPGDHTPKPNPTAARIIAEVRRQRGARAAAASPTEIVRRLVMRMVSEAFCVLEEGLCQRPSDLDVAMVLGTGLADFRGGIVKYAYDLGLNHVRAQLEELAAACGKRYAPNKLLDDAFCLPNPAQQVRI